MAVIASKELPRVPSMPVGSASRDRWGYLVLGAVRALCLADGLSGPDDITAAAMVNATWNEPQADLAIRAAVARGKFGRATAALDVLRKTNAMAGRK